MCGIVAVVRRPSQRGAPDAGAVLAELAAVASAVTAAGPGLAAEPPDLGPLAAAAERLEAVDASLRGSPGLACLLAPAPGDQPATVADGVAGAAGAPDRVAGAAGAPDRVAGALDAVAGAAGAVGAALDAVEDALDAGAVPLAPEWLEAVNAALVRLRDAWWSVARDRVGAARQVADLSPPGVDLASPAALDALWSLNVALGSLDRLEVRGRDSAGVHVLLVDHGVDPTDEATGALLGARASDPLFASMAARTPPGTGALCLVYKAAAEIGELGDNVAALRAAIRSDGLLGRALQAPSVRATVLGHTRWASVGVISQANAHPLSSDELDRVGGPHVAAALNGDVDNHLELRLSDALRFPEEITTDAKVIPALVSRRMADGEGSDEAFRATVARFEGSVAIAASAADDPDRLHLALRGSGQSLYVGLAPDAYVVASEPYGLVEEAGRYVRMDGEATRGQVMSLDRAGAGGLGGLTRRRYDGGPLPLDERDLASAGITTRDIDRGAFPHFLLKEISESPSSLRKTLRGKVLAGADGRLSVGLGPDALPPGVVDALAAGTLRRILVVGQGTAAVAGRAAAAAFAHCLPELTVAALPASELSGFGLVDDMSDTLVVAVSQSGTTTDTNRTVDLVRSRGAHVVAVVNRRHSDLTTKAHGTLYTSDGRDVEMSVASTKAFYAQVAAGWLLALGLAAGAVEAAEADRLLRALRSLPELMEQVLRSRPHIARIAGAVAPSRRYWTVVGSGPDAVAAAEVRIKCSELCYRSIACDTTEDKKHIDLSCEPLVLVCAAALTGPNADDVAKEVAIYRAHKALPVVIAAEGETARFGAAREVVAVPACEPELAFVLSAMVGHLFGYEAALAIDAQARPLRAARAVLEASGGVPADDLLRCVGSAVAEAVAPFSAGLASGAYNGNLEASTAVRIASLLRYVTGAVPVEGYEAESGKVGSPGVIVADLFDALSDGVDELTRPVDAIKHQAKTVTVGTSRSEEALLALPLVKETLAAGASADALGYRSLRTLGHLDPAVSEVLGYTRYRIDWPSRAGAPPTAAVVDRGGVARGLRSRTASDPRLRGTKRRAAEEREVTVARGASDGRTVVLVPEVKANTVVGMTLLHVRFAPALAAGAARAVLAGYRGRYNALRDAVTETEPSFDDTLLAEVPLVDLLTEPVYVLAARWRRASP